MIKKIEGLYNNRLEKIEEHTGWYYSFDDYVDLYEIEESLKYGNSIPGNEISFFTYPEKMTFSLDDNLSFAFRDGDRFYFSYWKEEGYDDDGNLVGEYKYYELYVVKDKSGNIIEKGIGYIERMPDGKYIIA